MVTTKRELKLVALLLGTVVLSNLVAEPITVFISENSPVSPLILGGIGFGIMLYFFDFKGGT